MGCTSWPFCFVLQEQWYPGTQQDVPGTSLPWVMLSLGAARQQLGWQMSIWVPGDPHYTGCSAITALGHCAGSPRRWKSVLQPAPCCDYPLRRGMKSCRNHLFHLNHLLPLHLVWCKLHARIISCRSLLMDDLFIGWSIFGIFFDWWDRLVSEGIFWSFRLWIPHPLHFSFFSPSLMTIKNNAVPGELVGEVLEMCCWSGVKRHLFNFV